MWRKQKWRGGRVQEKEGEGREGRVQEKEGMKIEIGGGGRATWEWVQVLREQQKSLLK